MGGLLLCLVGVVLLIVNILFTGFSVLLCMQYQISTDITLLYYNIAMDGGQE